MAVNLIISDFDGTLVDTFRANFLAYRDAFATQGLTLTEQRYRECFGFRFDKFMEASGISDKTVSDAIRSAKKEAYPHHFEHLRLNLSLIRMIEGFHALGGRTAIASTARRTNLMNALRFLGIERHFDLILAGEDVTEGKPSPQIYLKAMQHFDASPSDTIIFEDSAVGFSAAQAAGVFYIPVTSQWFEKNEN